MLTVSKGPSKIVAKTRRGVPQNYEKLVEIKESGKRSSDMNSPEKNNIPRPVFKKSPPNHKQMEEPVVSPQHEEIIRYINDSWNVIVAQNPYDAAYMHNGHTITADSNNNSAGSSIASTSTSASSSACTSPPTSPQPMASIYCVEPPSPVLRDFKPFDLVTWWYDRLCNAKST